MTAFFVLRKSTNRKQASPYKTVSNSMSICPVEVFQVTASLIARLLPSSCYSELQMGKQSLQDTGIINPVSTREEEVFSYWWTDSVPRQQISVVLFSNLQTRKTKQKWEVPPTPIPVRLV